MLIQLKNWKEHMWYSLVYIPTTHNIGTQLLQEFNCKYTPMSNQDENTSSRSSSGHWHNFSGQMLNIHQQNHVTVFKKQILHNCDVTSTFHQQQCFSPTTDNTGIKGINTFTELVVYSIYEIFT